MMRRIFIGITIAVIAKWCVDRFTTPDINGKSITVVVIIAPCRRVFQGQESNNNRSI